MIEFLTSDLFTSALLWLLPVVGGFLLKIVHKHLKWKRGAEMLSRLGDLAARAVVAVHAEYTAVIREGRADGTLTVEERAEAKRRALGKLKEYCGFDDLAYVVGSAPRAEVAMSDAVESALVAAKAAGVVPRGQR
jgi:hypothetical protein